MASYQNDRNVFSTPKGALVQRYYTKGKNKGEVYFRIEWNPGFGPKCTSTFRTAQQMFTHECVRLLDPYVPKDTGLLKNTALLGTNYETGEVVYSTPYAQAQYYLHPQGTSVHDGKRGSYWGQRMAADHKNHLRSFAAAAIRKGMNG
ncbi:MAG: hypothetical protein IJ347_09480 [Faecalibacterium sp.]|nr:hypothetical protein [Faecalibacterium sp.]